MVSPEKMTEGHYLDRASTGSLITTDRQRETQSHRHRHETKQTKTTTNTAASCRGRHCTNRMVSAAMNERQYLDQAWTETAEIETQSRGCELESWCSRLHGTRTWSDDERERANSWAVPCASSRKCRSRRADMVCARNEQATCGDPNRTSGTSTEVSPASKPKLERSLESYERRANPH